MQSEKTRLVKEEPGPSSFRYGALKTNAYDPRGSTQPIPKTHFTTRDCLLVVFLIGLAAAAIAAGLIFGLPALDKNREISGNLSTPVSASTLNTFKQFVVATDAALCAPIGSNILKQNGSAVDAAIATLFCNGAVNPDAMGIGGGVIFTIYDPATKKATIIDGREVAPDESHVFPRAKLLTGPLSIAVPGELKAYEQAYLRFGKLPWENLVQPTIDLCKKGIKVSKHFAGSLAARSTEIANDPDLRAVFFNKGKNRTYIEGETIKYPTLASTLEMIRDGKSEVFYNGPLGQQLIEDLTKRGAKLTLEDLQQYQVHVRDALEKKLPSAKLTLLSPPPPGSGPVLSLILEVMDMYGFKKNDSLNVTAAGLIYHRLVETFKFAYAAKTRIGDVALLNDTKALNDMMSTEFAKKVRSKIDDSRTHPPDYYGPAYGPLPEDHGTAHTAVVASDGSVVSVTSTINDKFGSLVISPQTGIVLNNEMADFSLDGPLSGPNAVFEGRRPMSSMAPSVFVDSQGKPKFVLGGAGSTRITTGLAEVALRHLYFSQNVKQAIDAPRIHHGLRPDKVFYQKHFPEVLIEELKLRGHKVEPDTVNSAMGAISMDGKKIYANVDFRKGGSVAGV